MRTMRFWTLISVMGCVAALAPGAGQAAAKVDYSDPASWLCRPGRADVCSAPLTSTVVPPGGGDLARRDYTPDPTAPVDCFYVYPTVSREETANADMTASPEVQHAAVEQFARFGASCHAFAPIYRQTTSAAMNGKVQGADRELAYADVRDAWRSYLARDNHGRGFVLIGHSQGSSLLARLIAEEIDGRPVQKRLVSAIITGTNVQVPVGKDVGGSFQHIPLCQRADQMGCIIAYSTYLASAPPGPDAYFGKSEGPGLTYACVNPGALTHDGVLNSLLPTIGDVAKRLGTTFVENPGLISAACTTAGDRSFLAISVKPEGVGAATLTRVLTAMTVRAPGWGLHSLDINLALGDLVEIVGRQGRAWTTAGR